MRSIQYIVVDFPKVGRTMDGMKRLFLPMLSAAALMLLSCDDSKETPAAPTEALQTEAQGAPSTPTEPAAEESAPVEVPAMSEALQALHTAAEGGDAVAQNNLALAYAAGDGVPQDAARAFALYKQSAEQGNAVAAFNLARCYALGEGTAVDEHAFMTHCTKAAQAGYAPAQYTLGCAYRDGLGVPVDRIEAERWLSRAEMNDYAPAKEAWQALKNSAE